MLKHLLLSALIIACYLLYIGREISDRPTPYNLQPIEKNALPSDVATNETLAILQQNFFYLNKGAQCYAFVSEDGQWVLKLFKQKRLRDTLWEKVFINFPVLGALAKKTIDFKKRNRELLFTGIKTATQHCKEMCGILYIHPTETSELPQKMVLEGTIFDPNKLCFVLQKRADPAPFPLTKEQHCALEKRSLERSALCIIDQDRGLHKNVGFEQGEAYFIDFGEFTFAKPFSLAAKQTLR